MHCYTRTKGKKLKYEIEVTGTGYVIRLNGLVMKDETEPMICEGIAREAHIIQWAVRDIEELDGMSEE
jgi:hypothetical protein